MKLIKVTEETHLKPLDVVKVEVQKERRVSKKIEMLIEKAKAIKDLRYFKRDDG